MMPSYSSLPDDFKRYVPDFEYLLIDLSDFDEDTIKLNVENMMALKVLTKTRYTTIEEIMDILREVVELIEDAEEKDDIAYYVSVCVKYIFSLRNDISKSEVVKMAGQISIEGGELVMSVAEQLRQEGKIEGRQEGIEEGIKRTAKIMIVDGESIEKIIRYTRLTQEEIDEIKEEILR